MQLSTMQDIGGARVVVDTLLQARVLQERLRSFSPYFKLKLPMKDYILNPNPKSGYRGLHLVFSFQDQTEQYRKLNGLKIELQIRTRLQHVWATAVETVGTFRGESLKSGEGNPDWLEFFRLAGSLFADLETNMGSVPPELAALRDVLEVQERLGAYNLIQSVARYPELHPQWVGAKYVVLVLNLQEGSVRVDWFAADQFAKAVERQREQEARYLGNKNFDTVLVSVDSLTGLHEGYPNYFADTGDFVNLVYGFRPREANYGVWANLREGA
jgi:putative GTP pyrophosphokinase